MTLKIKNIVKTYVNGELARKEDQDITAQGKSALLRTMIMGDNNYPLWYVGLIEPGRTEPNTRQSTMIPGESNNPYYRTWNELMDYEITSVTDPMAQTARTYLETYPSVLQRDYNVIDLEDVFPPGRVYYNLPNSLFISPVRLPDYYERRTPEELFSADYDPIEPYSNNPVIESWPTEGNRKLCIDTAEYLASDLKWHTKFIGHVDSIEANLNYNSRRGDPGRVSFEPRYTVSFKNNEVKNGRDIHNLPETPESFSTPRPNVRFYVVETLTDKRPACWFEDFTQYINRPMLLHGEPNITESRSKTELSNKRVSGCFKTEFKFTSDQVIAGTFLSNSPDKEYSPRDEIDSAGDVSSVYQPRHSLGQTETSLGGVETRRVISEYYKILLSDTSEDNPDDYIHVTSGDIVTVECSISIEL